MEYIVKLNSQYYIRICRAHDTSCKNKNQRRLNYTLWKYKPKSMNTDGDIEISSYKSFIDAFIGMWRIKNAEKNKHRESKNKKYERVPYELFWDICSKLNLIEKK